jgi:hypothetical protein
MAAAALGATASALLQTSLGCPVGARRARLRPSGLSEPEESLLRWARYEQWLHAQRDDWRAHLRTRACPRARQPRPGQRAAHARMLARLRVPRQRVRAGCGGGRHAC